MAVATRNVFIIGANLYSWFSSIAAYIGLAASRVYVAADDYLDFYNDVRANLNIDVNLGTLLYYAEDIISAIRDPGYWIRNTIRNEWPGWYAILSDPVGYIIETIVTRTGISYDALFDLDGFVSGLINGALGNIRAILSDPRAWLRQELYNISPFLFTFLNDPVFWLRTEIALLTPGLKQFLDDPEGYILDKVVTGLEKFLERYGVRLAKIAERVINAIF